MMAAAMLAGLMLATQALAMGGRGGARRGELRNFLEFYNEYQQAALDVDDIEFRIDEKEHRMRELEDKKSYLRRDLRSLENEKEELKKKISRLNKGLVDDRASLQVARTKKQRVEARLPGLRNKVRQEQAILEPVTRRLATESQELSSLTTRLNQMETHKSNLLRKTGELKKRVDGLNSSVRYLETSLANLTSSLVTKNDALRTANVQLAAANKNLKAKEVQAANIASQIRKLPKSPERKRLNAQLKALNKQIKGQRKVVKQKLKVRDQAKASVVAIQRQKTQVEVSLRNVKSQIPSSQAELDTARAALVAVKRNIPVQKGKVNAQSSVVAQLRAEYTQASRALNEALAKKNVAEKELSAANSQISRMQRLISEAQSSLGKKTTRLTHVKSEIPSKENQLERAHEKLVHVESELLRLRNTRHDLLDVLEFPVMSTNNGEIVHFMVGGVRGLSRDAQYILERSLEGGQKVIFWVVTRPNQEVMYRLEGLTGVLSNYGVYDSNTMVGEGVLSGLYVQANSERDYLEISRENSVLLMTRNQRVAMTAKRSPLGNTVVITTTMDPNQVDFQTGRTILDRIAMAHPADISPEPMPPAPVDPPPYDDYPPTPVDPPPYDDPNPPVNSETIEVTVDKLGLSIPDNDEKGVGVELEVKADYNSTVESLQLEIEILHTYIGDVEIELTAPNGTTKVLRSREGGSSDDLMLKVSGELLRDFVGLSAEGVWNVTVKDRGSSDYGTVENVKLVLVVQ